MIQRIKTDEEVMQTMDDLEMMRRTHLWPGAGTRLCLKKPGKKMLFALLIRNAEHYVFEPHEGEIRQGRDALLIELINEGWLVD